jgi:intein/homing endonuclease
LKRANKVLVEAYQSDNGYRNSQATVIAPVGCTPSTTRIRTDSRVKSYRDIMDENGIDWRAIEQTNDKRWIPLKPFLLPSYDGHIGNSNKIWYNGHAETYTISFEDGSTFECTKDHKLLVRMGGLEVWIEASNLIGDEDVVSY